MPGVTFAFSGAWRGGGEERPRGRVDKRGGGSYSWIKRILFLSPEWKLGEMGWSHASRVRRGLSGKAFTLRRMKLRSALSDKSRTIEIQTREFFINLNVSYVCTKRIIYAGVPTFLSGGLRDTNSYDNAKNLKLWACQLTKLNRSSCR